MTFTCSSGRSSNCVGEDLFDAPASTSTGDPICLACSRELTND